MTATQEIRIHNRTWATNPGIVRRHLEALEVLERYAPATARAVLDITDVVARRYRRFAEDENTTGVVVSRIRDHGRQRAPRSEPRSKTFKFQKPGL